MRGMRTSIKIRSGLTLGASSTASSPLAAVNTSYPAKRRVKATRSRISRSSSATNIFAIESSLCFINGQGKGECTSLTGNARAFHPDTSLVHLDNLFNDGQAQSGSWRGQNQRVFTPIEALKDPVLVLQRDAHAVILHIQLYLVAAVQGMDADDDRPILGCVVVGIIDQVTQHLADPFHVTVNAWEFLWRVQGQRHGLVLLLRAPQDVTHYILGHLTHVDRLRRKRDAP